MHVVPSGFFEHLVSCYIVQWLIASSVVVHILTTFLEDLFTTFLKDLLTTFLKDFFINRELSAILNEFFTCTGVVEGAVAISTVKPLTTFAGVHVAKVFS